MSELEDKAKWIRRKCVEMSHNAKEGHLGSALSCVDILVALYEHFNLDPSPGTENYPDRNTRPDRDRLYFSKGHACSALYATMAAFDVINPDALDHYAKGVLTPHPDMNLFPKLEMSSGSLGHGLGIACGAAYALKQQGSKAKCIVLMGDGECNEGSVWEAAQFAAAHKLDNLIVVVDYNRIQSIGRTDEISGGKGLKQKFISFGWTAGNFDGHRFTDATVHLPAMDNGLNYTEYQEYPTALIAHTTAGKGVSFMEDQILWHYRVPDADEVKRALEELK